MTDYISEKYRKYLLEIILVGQKYYTVFGADLTENETDKLLVDVNNKILLFSSPIDLLSSILKSTSFFDIEVLRVWAKEILDIKTPYSVINFDALARNPFDLKDVESFKNIYDAIGIAADYANQVLDEELIALLTKDILLRFKDDLADYFTWSETNTFKISVDINVLHLSLKELYAKLEERLNIYR